MRNGIRLSSNSPKLNENNFKFPDFGIYLCVAKVFKGQGDDEEGF